MNYQHTFRVCANLKDVANFHACSTSMPAITPPPISVRVQHAPEILRDGDEMAFTLWLGPLPIEWSARIANVSPRGFTDYQLRGPFRHWEHHHTFLALDETTTEVCDQIRAELRWHPWWLLVGLGMWLGLPILFAYRGWKTRRILA